MKSSLVYKISSHHFHLRIYTQGIYVNTQVAPQGKQDRRGTHDSSLFLPFEKIGDVADIGDKSLAWYTTPAPTKYVDCDPLSVAMNED